MGDLIAGLSAHPTLSWEAMQDGAVFYSRKHVYEMVWNLASGGVGDLSGYIIAGARFGGPIGMFAPFSRPIYIIIRQ